MLKKSCLFLYSLLLLSILVSANSVNAAVVQLKYDDDGFEAWSTGTQSGDIYAVRFSLEPGWSSAKIVRLYAFINAYPEDFWFWIFDENRVDIWTGLKSGYSPNTGWVSLDVGTDVVVTGDFYVGVGWSNKAPYPYLGLDTTSPDTQSIQKLVSLPYPSWTWFDTAYDYGIRVDVEPTLAPSPPSGPSGYVGGEVFSANKLAVLSPYLALFSVIAVAAVVVKRRLT